VNVVIGFFFCQSLFTLALDAFLFYAKLHWELNLSTAVGFASIAELGSATLAAALVLAGIWMIRKNRRRGYQLFKGAVLIQIFLVQVFLFYNAQLFALLGLAGNICVLLVLNYMISLEKAARGEAPIGS
jgi:heme A synthase